MNEHIDPSSADFGSEENEFEIKLRPAAFDDFSIQIIDYNFNIGDINSDSLINVLDVVLLVNLILDN